MTLGLRLTCDSRAQNKAIRRTRYPSNTVKDLVYLVNGAIIFSKLDILKAYHQKMLAEESRYFTTITTHIGLLRYLRLHMDISSKIFTEAIRVRVADLPGQLNMTDDVLVFGKTAGEHQQNLIAVLARLEKNGLTLNREKCEFYQKELTFYVLRFLSQGTKKKHFKKGGVERGPIRADSAFSAFLRSVNKRLPSVCNPISVDLGGYPEVRVNDLAKRSKLS